MFSTAKKMDSSLSCLIHLEDAAHFALYDLYLVTQRELLIIVVCADLQGLLATSAGYAALLRPDGHNCLPPSKTVLLQRSGIQCRASKFEAKSQQ